MTILVTGVAGFIGAAVARALLARGESVLGLDNLNAFYDPRLKEVRLQALQRQPGFRFLQLDIMHHEKILELVATDPDIHGIVHLAAQAGVLPSLTDPWTYADTNVTGQIAVLELARRLPACRHLVYASSSSVYGGNKKQPSSIEDRVNDPLSLYAATKRAGELISRYYARLYELPMTGLRFFTVYGPWGRPDMSPFLFTRAILEGNEITLYEEGRMRRDFTYIDDIVSGTLAALDRLPTRDEEGVAHGLYNLGSDAPVEMRHFLSLLETACGRRAKVRSAPASKAEPFASWADISASRRDLDFDPKVTLEEGLTRFVAWYRDFYAL